MTSLLLRAKHWQLFLIAFAIPIGINIYMIFGMFSAAQSQELIRPEFFFGPMFMLFPIIMLLSAGTLYLWMWSVGVGLRSSMPKGVTMNFGLFKGLLTFPIIYVFLFLGLLLYFFLGFTKDFEANVAPQGLEQFPFAMLLIIPLHLFAMFCQFYCLYFVSKVIVTVEKQKEITFSEHVGEFFLIWFWFIGLWILQPRINLITKEGSSGESLDSVFISKN